MRATGRERSAAIVLGMALDAVAADPTRYHPVAGFGRAAQSLEQLMWQPRRTTGGLYTACLVGSVTAAAACAGRLTASSPRTRLAMQVLLVWTVLGGRSL